MYSSDILASFLIQKSFLSIINRIMSMNFVNSMLLTIILYYIRSMLLAYVSSMKVRGNGGMLDSN